MLKANAALFGLIAVSVDARPQSPVIETERETTNSAQMDLRLAVESDRLLSEHEVLVSIGLSLMMLGPGAWSVDAVLFGRRRVHWVDHR